MRIFVSAYITDILGGREEGEDENICERFTYRQLGEQAEGEDDDEMSMVPTDAWSTKQAGVAQGEHYYSFVRSDSDDIDETAAHLVDGMQA